MSNKSDYTFKVVIIGNSCVGKTQLAYKLCDMDINSESTTIAADTFKLKMINNEGRKLLFNIWDTAGQQKYRTINKMYFNKADAIIFMYSIIDPQTMQIMKQWVSEALDHNQNKPMCVSIVGNKIDLNQAYKINNIEMQQVQQLIYDYPLSKIKTFTISAKTGQNVKDLLNWMAETLSQIAKDRNPIGDRPIAISLAASSFIKMSNQSKQKQKCCV